MSRTDSADESNMLKTQLKGNQILDGTIESQDLSDSLKDEFVKVATTTGDAAPNYLFDKLVAGSNVSLAVIGASGSNQTLQVSAGCCETGWHINTASVVFTTSSIRVEEDATVDGTLYGNGGLEFAGSVFLISGSLLLSGTADIHGDLIHSGGDAAFSADEVILSGTLSVSGSSDFHGSLTLNGSSVSTGGWQDVWSADLTSGQMLRQWTSGVSYPVVGVDGTSLLWTHNQGSGVTAAMASTGLQLCYPSPSQAGNCGNISFALDDLDLSGFGGRPWRVSVRLASNGTVVAGTDSVQLLLDLDGSSVSSADCLSSRPVKLLGFEFNSSGFVEVSTSNIGGGTTSNDAGWSNLDVVRAEQICGSVAVKLGTFAGGFPDDAGMFPLSCGSIAGQSGPYPLSSRISLRIEAGGISPQFSAKTWTVTHISLQCL